MYRWPFFFFARGSIYIKMWILMKIDYKVITMLVRLESNIIINIGEI